MKSKKKYTGATPRYKNPEEIEALIDAYFKECDGVPDTDENGQPLTTEKGVIIYKKPPKPPTVAEMARLLLNYQDKLYI